MERVPVSIGLVFYASLISLCLTFPIAFIAARNRDRPVDHLIRGTFLITLGMPSFWVALMLMLIFSIKLASFPISGKGQNLLESLRFLFACLHHQRGHVADADSLPPFQPDRYAGGAARRLRSCQGVCRTGR